MADIYIELPQALTGGNTKKLKIKLLDNGDETFSWDISTSLTAAGLATAAKQDTMNIKLDNLITAVEALGAIVEYIKLIDDTTTTDVTYLGYALPTGAAIPTSSAVWRIKKIDETGAVTSIKLADGNSNLDNVWDDRVTIIYN